MSRLSTHPVRERLVTVSKARNEISEVVRKEATDRAPETLPRLDAVLEQAEAVLAAADPALLTEAMLTDLESSLSQAEGHVTSLASEPPDYDYLDLIETALDTVVTNLAALGVAPALEPKEVKRVASAFGRAADEQSIELGKRAKRIDSQLAKISAASEEAVEEIKTAAAEQVASLTATQADLEAQVATQTTKIAEAVAAHETQFMAAEEKRQADYAELKTGLDESFQAWTAELRDAHDKSREAVAKDIAAIKERIDAEAAEILTKLNESKDEAKDLVDLVATSATAGAFGKEAQEQKTEADTWRERVLWIGGVAAALALASVVYTIIAGFELEAFLPKLVLTAAIGALATYAGKQSGDHRRREQRAKRLELELLAFNPMTERLTAAQAQATRISFIERAFVGEQAAEPSAKGEPADPHSPAATSTILDLLGRIVPDTGAKPEPPATP